MRIDRRLLTAAPILLSTWRWPVWCMVGGGYFALTLVFFWPSLWYGMAPLPLLNPSIQPDPVWASMPTRDTATGVNLLLGDVSGFYYPYLTFTIATLRAGEFPLWLRGLFGGVPYFASNQAALLYPINLLCYGLGPVHFWVVSAILRLMLAGVGTYLLVRRLGASPLGALLSGGIYMFAPTMLSGCTMRFIMSTRCFRWRSGSRYGCAKRLADGTHSRSRHSSLPSYSAVIPRPRSPFC